MLSKFIMMVLLKNGFNEVKRANCWQSFALLVHFGGFYNTRCKNDDNVSFM